MEEGARGRELPPTSLPSCPTRAPRPRDRSQDAGYPNDVIDRRGYKTSLLSSGRGIRPSLVPLSPLQRRLWAPTTQRRYLFAQRLAVRDERGHLPNVATASFGHGVLAAWEARAQDPGMIGGSAEVCGAAPKGVRSARRPRQECAELTRARRRRRPRR